jgi:hypothetical protein
LVKGADDSIYLATVSGVYGVDRTVGSVDRVGSLDKRIDALFSTWSGALYARGDLVYRSIDHGTTWQVIEVPAGCSYLCTYSETLDGYILAGTELGLYRSKTRVSTQTALTEYQFEPGSRIEIAPNPARVQTAISVSLAAPEDVDLSIHDVTGRTLSHLHTGILPGGTHRFLFKRKGIANGAYFLVLRGERTMESRLIWLQE